MNRREFLTSIALILLSGYTLQNVCKEELKKVDKRKIYESASRIYEISTKGKVESMGRVIDAKMSGVGIVYNQKFLTVAHVVNLKNRINNPLKYPLHVSSESYVNENKLEKELIDFEKDVAIFKIPENLKLNNFSEKTDLNIFYGKEVYLIGNPSGFGTNIRKGEICDLDGYLKEDEGYFGINCPTIPGDSGSPVVNKYGELMGITAKSLYSTMGYIKKIEEFIK